MTAYPLICYMLENVAKRQKKALISEGKSTLRGKRGGGTIHSMDD